MEFKGTKGEWKISTTRTVRDVKKGMDLEFNLDCVDIDDHYASVFVFSDDKDEGQANAKLIAAAPTMLKVLQDLSKIEKGALKLESFDFERMSNEINAAIKKAIG